MFLAGLFLPVDALPKPAQCSGSVTMDTKHRALTLTWAVLSGSCRNCPVWDPDLLPVSSRTSLVWLPPSELSRVTWLWSPALWSHFPAKSPFSIQIWWWSQWPNSILHAKVLSCSGWDPGLGWEPQMLLMQQGSPPGVALQWPRASLLTPALSSHPVPVPALTLQRRGTQWGEKIQCTLCKIHQMSDLKLFFFSWLLLFNWANYSEGERFLQIVDPKAHWPGKQDNILLIS